MVENDFSGLECKGYMKHKIDLKFRLRPHSQIISMDKRVFQNLKLEAFLIKDAQLCCLLGNFLQSGFQNSLMASSSVGVR